MAVESHGCLVRLNRLPRALSGTIYFIQIRSDGIVWDNLFPPNTIRIDGATSMLLYSAKAAAVGNCQSAAWPCGMGPRSSIGSNRHCPGQFISFKSDQNGWSYIHITLFRKSSHIWKLPGRGIAMGPRGYLPHCRSSIGFRGHCLGQFISFKSDQN
jgi:hypothetical protein